MKKYFFVLTTLSLIFSLACSCAGAPAASSSPYIPINDLNSVRLPEPASDNLPAWRGFNKLNLFLSDGEDSSYDDCGTDIRESDFALINKMGFNFVRFPIDYRFIYNVQTRKFDMEKIAWLDHAIEYAIKYNVHVEFCLHSAPGYSVVNFSDGLELLTSGRQHYLEIWRFLAARYKNIPNSILDFNLLNEPTANMVFDNSGTRANPDFVRLMRDVINIIREERPDRLIVLDSDFRQPFPLDAIGVPTENLVLAPHCYAPWSVTHEGMNGSLFPASFTGKQVTWPINNYFNGFLYGPWQNTHIFGKNAAAVFNNTAGFRAGEVSFVIAKVSANNEVVLRADGNIVSRISVFSSTQPGTEVVFPNPIPAGTRKVEIAINTGDWLNIDSYNISGTVINCTNLDWAYPPSEMTVGVNTITNAETIRQWLMPLPEWEGLPVMIGEMGCLARGAYEAVYRARLMRDFVDAFDDLPWAFWEFKGGAMSLFRLSSTGVFTGIVTVEYGDGKFQTYYYDELWFDAIKHSLDQSAGWFTN